MIVDCHTHIWQSPDQLGPLDLGETPLAEGAQLSRYPRRRNVPSADVDHHWQNCSAIDRCIVIAFKSRYLNAEIPSHYVADYVSRYPEKLIGFAGIDPTESTAVQELRRARKDFRLRGLCIAPAHQDFHPADSRAMRVYALAEELGMPMLVHAAAPFAQASKLEYARPSLLDEVARSFPRLRIIIAQMGRPWIDETLCLLGKHLNVLADLSGLAGRPWQAYAAIAAAYENQVIDKLLFGSDFPYALPGECIAHLYGLNQFTQGTNLPAIPREAIRSIIERDAVNLLGLGGGH